MSKMAAPWRNFCAATPDVEWVQYAGFPDSPYHKLAAKYLGGNVPSLLTFGVKGGFEAGKNFYDALKLIKRLVNIGDAKIAGLPSGLHHPPPDDGVGTDQGRRHARRRSGFPWASSTRTTSSPISPRRWRRPPSSRAVASG